MKRQILNEILRRRRREIHYLETNTTRRPTPKHNFPTIVTRFIESHGRAMPNVLAKVLAQKGLCLDLSDIAVKYFDGSEYKGSTENMTKDKIISSLTIHTSKKNKEKYFEFELYLNEPHDAHLNAPLAKCCIGYYGTEKNKGLVSEVEECIRQTYQR
ncbi:hypothetical protein JXB27_01625 [Candidatus Woesearchaeota archaeon]|nr:hypothetical protein [Candidatus Woesearchaeota archaeon]